jgi:hypothetical protein
VFVFYENVLVPVIMSAVVRDGLDSVTSVVFLVS